MTKISDIISVLEEFAPPVYQESYDNSGLITGSKDWETVGALLSLDCTEEVVDEAISQGCNLIVAHHPIIFSGLKKINGNNYIERTIIKAIKNDIAIYACHTNADNVVNGVNYLIAEKLGLKNTSILSAKSGQLKKLITFVPKDHHEKVLGSLFEAGAGRIGNYDMCSFNLEGTGTFRGNENSDPFIGEKGKLSKEAEIRLEVIFEAYQEKKILSALFASHPYEEVAYDLYALSNDYQNVGSGVTAELPNEMQEEDFLRHVAGVLGSKCLKYTKKTGKMVKKVAICGGSGRFLLKNAISSRADVFITADFKYHDFFDAENKLMVIDAGHYETEQFTPEIFYRVINKNFPTFVARLSKVNTNPVNYFV